MHPELGAVVVDLEITLMWPPWRICCRRREDALLGADLALHCFPQAALKDAPRPELMKTS